MFRMGGSSGTGITSGLDRPGYRNGIGPNMADVAGPLVSRPTQNSLTSNLTNKISSEAKRSRGIGLGTLPGFLTSFGLNLATQSPRGNIFATAAEAAKDPFDTFQQAKFAEAKEERRDITRTSDDNERGGRNGQIRRLVLRADAGRDDV